VPTWQNRGFFVNDEDQLGGWSMDPNGAKVRSYFIYLLISVLTLMFLYIYFEVFTLQAWDMVYQTLLRLKGNTIIIGMPLLTFQSHG
jgi:hypothetical protein